ncbi:LADA_0G01398g1_1 [Lachancea dasiensis]|uniref:Palmitoyltransferase n=1 Tax=Lachancea dasiensis TaxID=1072105 RepID=A0A1G4JQP4_9SACH|nr:LADA_0G01398g1_1 [Lachancea dasiensis]
MSSTNALSSESGPDQSEGVSLTSIEAILPGNGLSQEGDENNEGPELDSTLQKYREACQVGDLATVQTLVESGAIDLKQDYDSERVSGLHWASINNRLGVVQYLVKNGADVNFAGGNLNATPLHWAARYGYVYIVDYLLEHGADPALVDQQGFNFLHLSINSSNIMLVIYALYFVADDKVTIDSPDPNNRTPLLWAAYQGDLLSVKALIDFKANGSLVDSGGFSPLHWATVKGQPQVLKSLINYGCDYFQKTNDSKDCFVISKEMNTVKEFTTALRENGLRPDGTPITKYFSNQRNAKLTLFVTPWILVGLVIKLLATINVPIALVSAAITVYGSIRLLKKFVIPVIATDSGSDSFLKTPILAGLLFGSLLWVIYIWFTRIVPATFFEEPFYNLLFMSTATFCAFSFVNLVFSNPGKVFKEDDVDQVKVAIKELLRIGKYDTRHFCIDTYKRRPLRSKYSKFNSALIARFDHFCPWIYNDVGLRNHKLFLFFLMSLISGVACFAKTCLEYFDVLEDSSDANFNCGMFDDEICAGLQLDTFAFLVMVWAVIQGIWVSFLLLTQLFQTIKGLTNYELREKSLQRHGQDTATETFMTTPTDLMEEEELSMLTQSAINPSDRLVLAHSRGCFDVCCGLTGLDQFLLIVRGFFGFSRVSEGQRSVNRRSPINHGWKTNLTDFWLLSDVTAPLWQRFLFSPQHFKASLNNCEVDYSTLYTWPEVALSAEDLV